MNSRPNVNLNQLSNQELLVLEDELLLHNELAPRAFAVFSPGRRVITFLGLLCFLLLLLGLTSIFATLGQHSNPLLIFLYVGCLFASLLAARVFWERMGCYPRVIIRTALHYWTVTLTLVLYLIYGFRVSLFR